MYALGLGNWLQPSAPQKRMVYAIHSVPLFDKKIPIHRNQYHFGKKLGKGYFGEVYAARRLSDNRPVAIKVVSLATMHTDQAEFLQKAFLNEVEMAQRLAKTSRHIVHMYDFDFHQTGLSFIVMELGEQNLEKTLASRPPLSPAERKYVWRQLVDIAVTLYNQYVVHFDIKPDNLVIFPGNVVKLVDMGIARKARRWRTGPNGTVPYSAPEVTTIADLHMTMNSRKADIWSWGAVLYRMTYNQPPDFYYTPPCHRPPNHQHSTRDSHLRSVLRHTLVVDPNRRPDASWLAQHPYTNTP